MKEVMVKGLVNTCPAVINNLSYLHLPYMVGMADTLEHLRDTHWRDKVTLSHLDKFDKLFQRAVCYLLIEHAGRVLHRGLKVNLNIVQTFPQSFLYIPDISEKKQKYKYSSEALSSYLTNMFDALPTCTPLTTTSATVSSPWQSSWAVVTSSWSVVRRNRPE